MKERTFPGIRLLTAVATMLLLAMAVGAMAQTPSACTFPTAMASNPDQTAWQLFVAANCPSSGQAGPLTWQNWTEQTCWLNPSTPGCPGAPGPATASKRFLHGSQLRQRTISLKKNATGSVNPLTGTCSGMTTKAIGAPLSNYVPANLAANPTFCEEVFVNPTEAAFVTAPAPGFKLTTLTGQVAYGAAHNPITFPTPAVEVKADWLPATSLAPSFNCTTNPPPGVYVETINGACYALAAVHISSKLSPNWLWATFEPQSKVTNPNRCNPKLYSDCNDSWGSNPATSTGATTAPTPALVQLMTAAGLPKVFQNYRLVGTQTTYVTSGNKPIPLGNSFTEFNAEVLPQQASCITCHSYSGVTTSPSIAAVKCCTFPVMVGTPPATPANTLKDDFSWVLPFMPLK
jgi:hypothetical protein